MIRKSQIHHERKAMFDALPNDLTLDEVVRRIGLSESMTRIWMRRFGYMIRDRRIGAGRVDWSRVNWAKTNSQLARELDVTRERVRTARKRHQR